MDKKETTATAPRLAEDRKKAIIEAIIGDVEHLVGNLDGMEERHWDENDLVTYSHYVTRDVLDCYVEYDLGASRRIIYWTEYWTDPPCRQEFSSSEDEQGWLEELWGEDRDGNPLCDRDIDEIMDAVNRKVNPGYYEDHKKVKP